MPTTWKTVRVFISSTFREVRAGRHELLGLLTSGQCPKARAEGEA